MANEFTPAGSGAAVAPREPRVVDAGRGASWWSEGWRLFTPDGGVWLLIMLIMAIWFAPALVMLGELSPGAAMKASFHGCLQNVIPFLVYGAVGIVLAVIATIPFGLGWFVLGPVAIASVYASYCDIFEDKS